MSNIEDLFGKFENDQEKLDFMSAQFATITSLNKQLEQIKAEKLQLERLLKEATPVLAILPIKDGDDLSTEQKICKEQLKLLKLDSEVRALTLEECRKVETYSKILQATKDPNKKQKSSVDNLPIADLLKLVE
jgi:hypothetical protein